MAPSPAPRRPPAALLLVLLLLSILPLLSFAEPTADKASLLSFLASTPHSRRRITWDSTANATITACLWRGVTCNPAQSAVLAVRLPGTGLSGPIPSSTPLANLSSLRYLSLRSNALSGPLPDSLMAIPTLKGLYLQRNRFSGEIPRKVAKGILRLDLSQNQLSGTIPEEFGNLTALFLQRNQLSGEIPAALGNLKALVGFNVSDNLLRGPIPERLGARFPASAFAGNIGLCGKPLPPCAPGPAPAPRPSGGSDNVPSNNNNNNSGNKKRKRLSTAAIIAIAAGGGALLLLVALLLLAACCRHRVGGKSPKPVPTSTASGGGGGVDTATTSSASKDDPTGGRGLGGGVRLSSDKRNKLVVLDTSRDWYSFDLEDLLRASAEVLGKGALGTSYKATLEDGAVVVVKRLRGENAGVGKGEFEACMKAVARAGGGGDGHLNVQPLRAYYYSKDEKLLLFDYVPGGSLSATLHANRGTDRRTFLEWPSRLRIALTASRGLLHLHKSANLVHGNLKASNVLLRRDPDGAAAAILTDYALHPLFGPTASHTRGGPRASGYRAPEVKAGTNPTPASDVYGYGVLVLELLTGRSPGSPAEESTGGSAVGGDLPRWARSVVREEWTVEVIDRELVRYGSEEEMVRLLHVALVCTEPMPSERPTMEQVVKLVEDLAASAAAAEGDDSGTGKGPGIVSSSDDPASEATTPHAGRTP